jgi:hypothetical protein
MTLKQWQGGVAPLVRDNGDGSYTPVVEVSNPGGGGGGDAGGSTVSDGGKSLTVDTFNTKLRDAFQSYPGTNWVTVKSGAGDIIQVDGNAGGAAYLVVSLDPLSAGTETWIESTGRFPMPIDAAFGAHVSQRALGQEFSIEVVSDEALLPMFADLAIASIQQTGSVLSVTTMLAHGLRVGARIGVRDVSDSRMNYPALVVATTPAPNTFTATASPSGTIPSVSTAPAAGGFVFGRSAMGGSPNGTSMVMESAAISQFSYYAKAEGGDAMPIGGTLAGSHSVAASTVASVQAINSPLNYAFRPTVEQRLSLLADRLQWSDLSVDAGGQSTGRASMTQVVPNPDVAYKVRFRAVNSKSLTVPIAQIVNVSKAGSTTATIVFDRDHGLTTADQITAYGVRDFANFANLSAPTAIASIVNPATITVIWGAAVSAASYGGFVARVNGGNLVTATSIVTQSAAVSTAFDGTKVLTLIGSGNWLWMVGEYINVIGLRNAINGDSLGLDGAYRVRSTNATAIELERIDGTALPANFAAVNCGGSSIRRTDLRMSFVRLFDFERVRVEALPRPASDAASAFPVAVQGGSVSVGGGTIAVTQVNGGPSAEDAGASANPLITGGVVRTIAAPATLVGGDAVRDTMTTAGAKTIALGAPAYSIEVASAARTSTGNSGIISVATGGAISGLLVVSAVSGTNPTLDLTMDESFDNGVTWQLGWSAPRLTAAGTIAIPPMMVAGVRRWTWTVGGTTPSFTFAINTNHLAAQAPLIRSLVDRALNPNAVNAVSAALNIEGCDRVSMIVVSGAGATVSPVYTLEVSHSGVASEYTALVPAATLTMTPSTVLTTAAVPVSARFARVRISAAGTAATHTYAAIQATR